MSTITLPIKPLIVAMALGVTQVSLAADPSSCDAIIAVDTPTNTVGDGLTSFSEAWAYMESCSEDSSYSIQFIRDLKGSTLLLDPESFTLNGNRNVTLSLQAKANDTDADQLPIILSSSDATQKIFVINEGSALTTSEVTLPTEVFSCDSTFTVNSLLNDEFDWDISFDEAWSYINQTCASAGDYTITFDAKYNGLAIVLNNAPYEFSNDRNITLLTSEEGTVTLSSTNSSQALFDQIGNTALVSSTGDNGELVLAGSSGSKLTLDNVTVLKESLTCANEFTVDSRINEDYDYKYSFDEIWTLLSTDCPGSVEYTVNFNSSFNSASLTLDNYPYEVNDARIVSISASTSAPLTLNTSTDQNMFSVNSASELSLSGLVLDGLQTADRTAPAIISAGSDAKLTLTSVEIKGFYTTGDVKGAAISSTSPTTITNSTFSDNQVSMQGGAIRVSSADLNITNTSFSTNLTTAADDGGVANTDTSGNSDAGGGAIAFVNHQDDAGNTLVIEKGTFSNNQANGYGGAILIRSAKTITINESTFSTNTANNFSNGGVISAHGGALALDRSAVVSISDTTLDGNSAQRSGGALHISDLNADGSISLVETNLVNNVATEDGAAIYADATQALALNIEKTSINANTASNNGGALYVGGSLLTLNMENTTISGNSAIQGAGIYFAGAVVQGSSISHASIIENIASNGAGAIQAGASPVVSLSHAVISGNTGTVRQACVGDDQTGFSLSYSLVNEIPGSDGCADYLDDATNTLTTSDPLLGALENNGGKGRTHYPLETSPLVDMGNTSIDTAPEFDQRGSTRIMRGTIDIGAVEYGNVAIGANVISNDKLSPEKPFSLNVASVFTVPSGDSLTFTVSGTLPDGLTFDSATNIISGTPVHSISPLLDTYNTITVIATSANGDGVTRQSSFTLTVGYSTPVYSGLTKLAVNINSGLEWDLAKSTDADDHDISYALSGLPAGLEFTAENTVKGRTTIDMVANSPYTLTLQSIDLYDTTNTEITLKIVDPDDVIIITDDESGAASVNVWFLMGLSMIGLSGFRRRSNR
ncbi:MAG: choice-of-anchor Q domain-containing protein [Bermanella sp.]